jgi:hypothetical protein
VFSRASVEPHRAEERGTLTSRSKPWAVPFTLDSYREGAAPPEHFDEQSRKAAKIPGTPPFPGWRAQTRSRFINRKMLRALIMWGLQHSQWVLWSKVSRGGVSFFPVLLMSSKGGCLEQEIREREIGVNPTPIKAAALRTTRPYFDVPRTR